MLAIADTLIMIENELATSLHDTDESKIEQLYKSFHDKLLASEKPLPSPKKCENPYRCNEKATCYTDFKPHYPVNKTLSDLVIGKTNWKFDPMYYSEWSKKFGFLDTKPEYSSKGEDDGEIHLRVKTGRSDVVWICGIAKDSHKHSKFYIDLNTSMEDIESHTATRSNNNEQKEYEPTNDRVEWNKKKYVQNECTELYELPKDSTHIISVSSKGLAQITHVITW